MLFDNDTDGDFEACYYNCINESTKKRIDKQIKLSEIIKDIFEEDKNINISIMTCRYNKSISTSSSGPLLNRITSYNGEKTFYNYEDKKFVAKQI